MLVLFGDAQVSLYEKGKNGITVNLRDIHDDLESRYLQSASDIFEFTARTDGGVGVVEGSIRYHPFLFEKETYPLDSYADGNVPGDFCLLRQISCCHRQGWAAAQISMPPNFLCLI